MKAERIQQGYCQVAGNPGEQSGRRREPDTGLDAIAHEVIGAAIEVHRELGPGYLESVYEEALSVEFGLRQLKFARQVPVRAVYKGVTVGAARLDMLVEGQLVVELKTVDAIAPIHLAQVLSYLKAERQPLGLLINFKVPVLCHGVRRVILSR